MSTTVRLERTLPAPPDAVYRAWLEPDMLRRWLGPGDFSCARAEVDPQLGGRYRIWHVDEAGTDVGGAEGVFTELVPDQRIALRWHFVFTDRATPEAEESLLTISLAPGTSPATTDLTLVHDRLDGLRAAHPEIVDNVEAGWESVLAQLTITLEA